MRIVYKIDIIIICLLILLFNGNIKINIHGKVLEQDIATTCIKQCRQQVRLNVINLSRILP